MKRLASNPRKLKTLLKVYRVIKAHPSQSMTNSPLGQTLGPRVYIFNKLECVTFDLEVFRYLQMYRESSEKFRSTIPQSLRLKADPEKSYPEMSEITTKKKSKVKKVSKKKPKSKKIVEEEVEEMPLIRKKKVIGLRKRKRIPKQRQEEGAT